MECLSQEAQHQPSTLSPGSQWVWSSEAGQNTQRLSLLPGQAECIIETASLSLSLSLSLPLSLIRSSLEPTLEDPLS